MPAAFQLMIEPGEQRIRLPMRGLAWRVVFQQIKFIVAANDCPIFSRDALHYSGGKRSPIDDIPCDDDLIDSELLHIGENGFQRRQVAMNIGKDGQSSHSTATMRA